MPAIPGPSTTGNMQNPQGTVRYIRVPAGTTKANYNLRPATLNDVTTVNTPEMVTTTPVSAGRGQNNLQTAQVKQEPPTPGNVATPKTTSTTTIVKRGKGRGKKAPTVSVLDTTSETGEYYIRPCILGIDFLKKHGIFAEWTPTGKFKLITQQEFLV